MRPGIFLAMCLAGCAVTEQDYPAAWDPLPQPAASSCARFAGSYADRGETAGARAEPSLTYGLFGHHSAWKEARRVDLALPAEGVLEITAWDDEKPLFKRTLTSKAREFRCKDGELVVRSKRWVAADVVAGREDVTIAFSLAGPRLVAHVKESTYGAIFAVVPIAGTASHWYRFARVGP
ncbi:MAG TPA: hypothetical protein VFZ81_03045 [Burkholderiales bacterium]